nr:MAG TPA: Spectrin like domain [Caudoviricetes sp.]
MIWSNLIRNDEQFLKMSREEREQLLRTVLNM